MKPPHEGGPFWTVHRLAVIQGRAPSGPERRAAHLLVDRIRRRSGVAVELLDEPPSDEPVDRVHRIGGLRVIVLDSSRPGRGDGRLSPAQLDWLRRFLPTRVRPA